MIVNGHIELHICSQKMRLKKAEREREKETKRSKEIEKVRKQKKKAPLVSMKIY